MRTQHKNTAYFDQLLMEIQRKAAQIKDLHEALLAGRDLIVPGYELQISTNLILQLTIRYTRGDALADIAGLYPEIAERFIKSWNPRNVNHAHLFDVLTLGVLLDAPAETFARIGALVDRARVRDFLVDYFLAWRVPRPLHPVLKYQTYRPYNGLRQLAEAPPEAAPARLQEYLQKDWYIKSNTDIAYNSHPEGDAHGSFVGYWSFGAGAVAKIRGLDDAACQDSEYYPYDMVHWRA